MFNYFTGFITSTIVFTCVFILMGFQYGGTQHFNDIVANSITLVDKNGLGGSLELLDKDGAKLLSIKNGKIRIFNQSEQEVVGIMSDDQGRGNVRLKKGGYLDTYNDYNNKTAVIGENSNGDGIMSTFNNHSKQTSSIGSVEGGHGKLTIFDSQGRESINLVRSLTTFNTDGKITGVYGTNNSGNGSVMLYDRFGNRGWYKSGKKP